MPQCQAIQSFRWLPIHCNQHGSNRIKAYRSFGNGIRRDGFWNCSNYAAIQIPCFLAKVYSLQYNSVALFGMELHLLSKNQYLPTYTTPTLSESQTGHLRPRQARPSRSALSASLREIKHHSPTSHRPPYGMTSPISERYLLKSRQYTLAIIPQMRYYVRYD